MKFMKSARPECDDCNDTGVLFLSRQGNFYDCVARCASCNASERFFGTNSDVESMSKKQCLDLGFKVKAGR